MILLSFMPCIIFNLHNVFQAFVANIETFIPVREIKDMEQEHSVEEVLERPTGYPKVGGSNHGSGDFSLQPQRNPYLS